MFDDDIKTNIYGKIDIQEYRACLNNNINLTTEDHIKIHKKDEYIFKKIKDLIERDYKDAETNIRKIMEKYDNNTKKLAE